MITPRNIALVVIALLFLSVFSLRPIRLKIGDYYYERGNFEKATNWYEKAIRKKNLGGYWEADDGFRYEQLISKLKICLVRIMKESLLRIGRNLSLEGQGDSEWALTDPKIILRKSNSLFYPNPDEKIKGVTNELKNFDEAYEEFRILFPKEISGRELENFVCLKHFFTGLMNEVQDHFILAEKNYEKASSCSSDTDIWNEKRVSILPGVTNEYLYQKPIDWIKAKDFYENLLNSGTAHPSLYLSLAFIYAKFNKFADSLNYFKKAYDLLEDSELKEMIEYFRKSRIYYYPDDFERVPKKLIKLYPFLQQTSFLEIRSLLGSLGLQVVARSNEFALNGKINAPIEIVVRSAGYLVGNYALILIDGRNASPNQRGYNIVVLSAETGAVEERRTFDTSGSNGEGKRMADFIDQIETGKIVCVAVADDGAMQLSREDGNIFRKIGAKKNLHGKIRWAYGIIGVKGREYGEARELMSEMPVEILLVKGK